MLLCPVVFVVVLELLQAPLHGPTVDGIYPSTYGLMALAVGRIFYGLVALAPMIPGAAFGAGLTRRQGIRRGLGSPLPLRHPHRRRIGTALRRVVAGVATVALVVLAIALAMPARTASSAGGVAEPTSVRSNGHDLGLMIRGRNPDAPVLLFLPAGQGVLSSAPCDVTCPNWRAPTSSELLISAAPAGPTPRSTQPTP